PGNRCSLFPLNEDILPPHPHAAAGVNLQANHAIGEFRRVVRKVHDLHPIELRHDVIALHGYSRSFHSPGFSACSPSGVGIFTQPRPRLSLSPPVCLPTLGSTSTCMPSMSVPCSG